MYQSFAKSLVASALCISSLVALAQDAAIPRHLQLAREFVTNTKQENNSYSNRNIYTRMPGGDPSVKVMIPVSAKIDGKSTDVTRNNLRAVAAELIAAMRNQ